MNNAYGILFNLHPLKKEDIMNFGKRKFRYRGGGQVNESRVVTLSIIVGVIIVMLLIYFF